MGSLGMAMAGFFAESSNLVRLFAKIICVLLAIVIRLAFPRIKSVRIVS